MSSYHKFKHKSCSNFIFRISTKHQLQLQPNISISTKSSIKLQNIDQISTKIQFHNLYKISAEKSWPNSSCKSCLNYNFKILTKPCAQSLNKSLVFFTKPQLRNLQQIVANTILISNSYTTSTSFELASSQARVYSRKKLAKLQLQILPELQLQNLDQTLGSKSEQKFSFLTKPQLRNPQQIVANTILISNSYNINKFGVGIFTRQGDINQVY